MHNRGWISHACLSASWHENQYKFRPGPFFQLPRGPVGMCSRIKLLAFVSRLKLQPFSGAHVKGIKAGHEFQFVVLPWIQNDADIWQSSLLTNQHTSPRPPNPSCHGPNLLSSSPFCLPPPLPLRPIAKTARLPRVLVYAPNIQWL